MTIYHVTYCFPDCASRNGFYQNLKDEHIPEKARLDEGNIRYDYFIPADDVPELLLVEVWSSPEAQEKHMANPNTKRIGELKPVYGAVTSFEIYDNASRR